MHQKQLNFLYENVKLEILPPITINKDHHDIKCVLCGSIFNATPASKLANFKKWDTPGCPKCTKIHKNEKDKIHVTEKLLEMGYEVLSDYVNNKAHITVRAVNCCGRSFDSRPDNLLSGNSTRCRPCNDERKRAAFQEFNKERHQESLQYKDGFDRYKTLVRVLTEQIYRKYKSIINSNEYPRHRAGTEGYHLDHIVSIYNCFHAGVPPEVCAHPDNLQMLEWYKNAAKSNKPPKTIPSILESFLQ